MYFLTRKFWSDIIHDPREALDSLKTGKGRVLYNVVRFILFVRITLSEYSLNHCLTRASALSFALLLTLIPLLVSMAFMLSSMVEVRARQVEQFLSTLLPYAPETVLNYISGFFVNAQSIRGWGIVVLLFFSIGLFGTFEESFNTIWKVSRARGFFKRLRTFTMVMVWAPVLIILSISFRRSSWLNFAANYFFPIDILPFLLMVLAFTSLILIVPHTRVRFGAAFIGGLTAGVLFEIERRFFGMYVHASFQIKTIYGAFGMLPLFFMSLFFLALFILFGAQVAYVFQNFRPLLRAKRRWDRRVGDYRTYLTFRMFVDAVAAFMGKREPPSLRQYATKYELTEPQATGLLNWLIHAKLLHCVNGMDTYIPTRDFSKDPVAGVLDEIKAQDLRVPATPDDYTREFVSSLLTNSRAAARTATEQMTFEQMIANLDQGEEKFAKAAAIV
jgi:YihY family inner membrane protein